MISQTFVNHRLQAGLKKAIHQNPHLSFKLRMLENCGSVAVDRYGSGGVHVLSNGTDARLYGPRMCKHSWCCPVCSARQMSAYAVRIDCAIKALASVQLVPIMITFTMFHTTFLSMKDTFDIIRRAFTLFSKSANWKRKKADGTYYESGGAWNNFIKEFHIRHYIKAVEVTYGEHGWHPHFHNLYFVKKADLQKVANFESDIRRQWESKIDAAAKEVLNVAEYSNWRKLKAEYDRGQSLFISKTKDGKIMAMDTGSYICGWGAADELTNSAKKRAADGHYTLNQLLEEAVLHDNKKCMDLYLKFCEYAIVEKWHRIDFSRTGINKVITQYKQTEHFKEYLKKKRTAEANWQTIAWFTSPQWKDITYTNDLGTPVIPLMLNFACYPNGYELICELMESLGLPIPARRSILFDAADFFNGTAPPQKKDIKEAIADLLETLNDNTKSA